MLKRLLVGLTYLCTGTALALLVFGAWSFYSPASLDIELVDGRESVMALHRGVFMFATARPPARIEMAWEGEHPELANRDFILRFNFGRMGPGEYYGECALWPLVLLFLLPAALWLPVMWIEKQKRMAGPSIGP